MQRLHQMTMQLMFLIMVYISVHQVNGITSCDNALGMESGMVPDANITASPWLTATNAFSYSPSKARLNGDSSWCSQQRDSSSAWIQVTLGEKHKITGLKIQGNTNEYIWVKKYRVEYRLRGGQWKRYSKNLVGNSLRNYKKGKKTKLSKTFIAHDIRIYPIQVDGISSGDTQTFSPCLRMELYGCKHYVQCPHPGIPSNSILHSINLSHKGKARFSCHFGFTMIGPQVITCIKGRWDQALPVCREQCPDPGIPINGRRIGSTFLESNAVRFICIDSSYDLIGSSVLRCHSGRWSADTPTCKARCPQPGIPSKGVLVRHNVRHGGVAVYQCKKGFKLQGSSTIGCNNGKWNESLPYCVVDKTAARCPHPGIPDNSTLESINLSHKGKARFSCHHGFTIIGPRVITCIKGRWDRVLPICREQCPDPGVPTNGLRIGRTFLESSTVSFICIDSSYDLIGSPVLHCHSGKWSADTPTCKARCPQPGIPPKGVLVRHNVRHGGVAVYQCRKGFKLQGSSTIGCNNGKWNESLPNCVDDSAARCPHPGIPDNSTLESINLSHKGKALFSCHHGFTIVGPRVITCINGRWDRGLPICREQCPDPGVPTNGFRIGSTFLESNAVSFFCVDSSYDLIGSPILRCHSGRWSADTPTCKARCPHPRIPSNGVLVRHNVRHGGVAVYQCRKGFKLEGSSTIGCNNGKWDVTLLPSCVDDDDDDDDDGVSGSGDKVLVQCSDPGIPKNGGRQTSIFSEGNIVRFYCHRGFVLFGRNHLTCINGQWTGQTPECRKTCKNPGFPINGGRHGNNFVEGQNVQFFCNPGYELIGVKNPTCVAGQWSSQLPVCLLAANKCRMPDVPPNMRIHGARKPLYDRGDRVLYVCLPGHVSQFGSRIRICRGTRWSGIRFRCVAKSCGNPGTPRNGRKNGLVYSVHNTVKYSCNEGYALHGAAVLRCLVNTTWSHSKPECRAVDCGTLPIPSNGVRDITTTAYNGIATFTCIKKGYALIGSKTRRCQTNGRWSGYQPRCSPRSCGRPHTPSNGNTFASNGYSFESTITFTCNKGFIMQGNPLSLCLDDGTWSSPVPKCKRERCPVNWIKYNENCYFFKHNTRRSQTWKRLKSRCTKLNAKLVDLHDNQEWNFIKSSLKQSLSYYAVGLRRSNGVWEWNTGSPAPLWVTSGISMRPQSRSCGVMKGWNGEFAAVPCKQKTIQSYICKK